MKANWKIIGVAIGMLAAGVLIGRLTFQRAPEPDHATEHAEEKSDQVWTCAMHPQIRQNEPGDCPICGMELVPVGSGEELAENMFQMSQSAVQLANIQTSVVQRGNADKEITFQGKVQQDERSISLVTARFAGRLDALNVNFTGAEVKKGQVLASVYSPQLVTAQRELLEAMKIKEENPKIYQAARGKLRLWDLTDAQITAIENGGEPLEHIDILSPITGIVTNRMATLGEYVKEGSVLFHVTDLSRVWVLFDAYESDLPFIRKGLPITFSVNSLPGKKFKANVTFVDPVLDAKKRTASVRVEVSNADWSLKPEMFANGEIKVKGGSGKELLVPRSAVMWTGKRSVVYVKVPDTEVPVFEFREVTLGSELGGFYEVKDGISEGEEVVTNGTFKVDAAAQLVGKKSMMNRTARPAMTGHDHGSMKMGSSENATSEMSEAKFIVYGNCGMCQKRIEKAAMAVPGVMHAAWNKDTKEFVAHFNGDKTSKDAISKAIAGVGHDTEFDRSTDEAYEDLAKCCLYDRQKK